MQPENALVPTIFNEFELSRRQGQWATTMKNRPFFDRLGFAAQGLREGWRREQSFRVQVLIGLFIVLSVMLFGASGIWLAIVALAIALVLAAELFNSALEALIDLLHPEIHSEIRVVKDMAAAGVLLICVGALVIGLLFLASHG